MYDVKKYEQFEADRRKYVGDILKSPAAKKIVVGGPGTGKTYLFQEILKGKAKCLTITFINSLVEDLTLELCGLSEVRTLHSFAHSQLKKKDIKVYPKLARVISEDRTLLVGDEVDFKKIFENMDVKHAAFGFYAMRKNYYQHYGFDDIIYAAVMYFRKYPVSIPKYELVLVDEFQDFNRLEVALVDLLSKKSPVLIVGDDDQALYEFKSASTYHIREKYNKPVTEYSTFCLPYCSRSTKVIVDAANDLIGSASEKGLLVGRIQKPFKYFANKEKDIESSHNPKIIFTQQVDRRVHAFIASQIDEIAKKLRYQFSVLVISPFGKQSSRIANRLTKYGFRVISHKEKTNRETSSLLHGFKLLLENEHCNLGWRIVAKILLGEEEFRRVLNESAKEDAAAMRTLLDPEVTEGAKRMLTFLRKIKRKQSIDFEKLSESMKQLEFSPFELEREFLRAELSSEDSVFVGAHRRKIPVTATTIESSKGLTSDYVFITHFDDRYLFPDGDNGKISDNHVCKLLVAMTRARRKVYLISTVKGTTPTFLGWINGSRIKRLKTD